MIVGLSPGLAIIRAQARLDSTQALARLFEKGMKNMVFLVVKSRGTSSSKLNFFEEPGLGLGIGPGLTHH